MKQIRLHPAHFIKYIKYALLLCVIPIIRAVLAFDILAAWLAFTQDLLILLSCGGILAAFWQSSAAFLEEQAIWVRWGVLFRRLSSYPVKQGLGGRDLPPAAAAACRREQADRLF